MMIFGNQIDFHITAPFTEHTDGSILLGICLMEGEYECGCPLLAMQIGLLILTITITIGNNHTDDEYTT